MPYIKTKFERSRHHFSFQFATFSSFQLKSSKLIIMQVVAVFLAVVAVAAAGGIVSPVAYSAGPTYLTRAPRFDSAVIKSDRLGGNFAYSVAESHAYQAHTPIVQHVTRPVGVSYTAGAPVVTGYSAPVYAHSPIAYNGQFYNGAYNGYNGYASPYFG